jgi:hypothetical protein
LAFLLNAVLTVIRGEKEKDMKETLEFLKRDRKVNQTFMDKLAKVGLEVSYGTYSYWDNQEYVQIGRERVWLVETEYTNHGNSFGVVWRYQNDVIKEIIQTINEQKKSAEEADELVNNFFEKLSR